MGHGTENIPEFASMDEIADEWERPRFSAGYRDALALELSAHRLADACWAHGLAAHVQSVGEGVAVVRVRLLTVKVTARRVQIDGVASVRRGTMAMGQLVGLLGDVAEAA